MPGITELLAGLADGFNVVKSGLEELKITRTRGATTEWHDVIMESVQYTPGAHRPDKPVWTYDNPMDVPISLRRIEVLFDDEPDDAYKPIVEIRGNRTTFFKSKGNAFANQDLAVDLYGGRPVNVSNGIEVYVWAAAAVGAKRTITISAQFGEV